MTPFSSEIGPSRDDIAYTLTDGYVPDFDAILDSGFERVTDAYYRKRADALIKAQYDLAQLKQIKSS